MKAIYKNSLKQLAAAGILMAMVGCGTNDNGGGNKNSAQPAPQAPQADAKDDGKASQGEISDGKYYLSSGTFEGSDTAGNKIDRQTLQIAGDYYWKVEHQGDEKYEVTATGNAKLSSENTILAEINCVGSQDVYSFEVVSSGALRNFAQLESGCPQSAQLNSSQQMSMRALNANAFEYTVVSQSEGVRIIETFVFRK